MIKLAELSHAFTARRLFNLALPCLLVPAELATGWCMTESSDISFSRYDAGSLSDWCPTFGEKRIVLIFKVRPLKMRRLRCLETSDTNHQVTLRHISKERRPRLHRCESLNTRICCKMVFLRCICLVHVSVRKFWMVTTYNEWAIPHCDPLAKLQNCFLRTMCDLKGGVLTVPCYKRDIMHQLAASILTMFEVYEGSASRHLWQS